MNRLEEPLTSRGSGNSLVRHGFVPRVRYVLAECHLKFICPVIGVARKVNRS
jgi:hypothetical protein